MIKILGNHCIRPINLKMQRDSKTIETNKPPERNNSKQKNPLEGKQ